jgi:hypothetical protein
VFAYFKVPADKRIKADNFIRLNGNSPKSEDRIHEMCGACGKYVYSLFSNRQEITEEEYNDFISMVGRLPNKAAI